MSVVKVSRIVSRRSRLKLGRLKLGCLVCRVVWRLLVH